MPSAKRTTSQELKALKLENARLKRQLNSLQTSKVQNNRWRTALIVLLAGTAGAIFISANLLFWTARTLVETDRYTEATKSLIQKPAVQKAIADKTTERIFAQINTEQLLEESLPPRVKFAAPTLSQQIENFTNKKAREITASERFQTVWVNTNANAHKRLITGLRDYKGDGTINISDVYNRLTDRLKDTKLSFLQNVRLPSSIGSIKVLDAPWLKQAHWLVVNLQTLRIVTIALFLVLTGLIVAVARQRRRVVVRLGLFYAVLMFTTLVSVRIARAVAVAQVDPIYQQAATEAYQAILNPFVIQTATLMTLGIVIALIAWLIGPSKLAQKIKQPFVALFEGKIHSALFGKKENRYTKWVRANKAILQAVVTTLAFISLLFVSISIANIFWLLIALLIAVSIIEVSAAKR